MKEGKKGSAFITKSWKKLFDSGTSIPLKMRCLMNVMIKKSAKKVKIKSMKIKNSKLI